MGNFGHYYNQTKIKINLQGALLGKHGKKVNKVKVSERGNQFTSRSNRYRANR